MQDTFATTTAGNAVATKLANPVALRTSSST
jgi:hypothetical protein